MAAWGYQQGRPAPSVQNKVNSNPFVHPTPHEPLCSEPFPWLPYYQPRQGPINPDRKLSNQTGIYQPRQEAINPDQELNCPLDFDTRLFTQGCAQGADFPEGLT